MEKLGNLFADYSFAIIHDAKTPPEEQGSFMKEEVEDF